MSKKFTDRLLFAVVVCLLLALIAFNLNRRRHQAAQRQVIAVASQMVAAASAGDYDRVLHLLNNGVAVDAVSEDQETALLAAAGAHPPNQRLMNLLLDRGAKVDGIAPMPNRTPLMVACAQGNRSLAQILIAHGANINAADRDYMARIGHQTPLMYAIYSADPEVVSLMFDAGADVSLGDFRRRNAFMLAVQSNRLEMVRLFLDRGTVTVSSTSYSHDHRSGSGLEGGSSRTRYPHPADMDAGDYIGATALMMAIDQNRVDIARTLLEHGADINAHQRSGRTALQIALYRGFTPSVKLLIAYHVDVKSPGDFNGTPLHTAQRVRRPDLMELLRQAGAVR